MAIRLSKELAEQLENEADARGITLGSNLARILTEYGRLYSPAAGSGMFLFPKKLVPSMLEELDESKIKRLSEEIAKRDFTNLMLAANQNDPGSFIRLLSRWAVASGFSLRQIMNENATTVAIRHDLGEKWSLLLAGSIKYYFEKPGLEVALETRDDMIIIRLENLTCDIDIKSPVC